MNQILDDAKLDFQINAPDALSYTQYQPTLTKKSNGIHIPFSGLSSGEKILMSFAFCVYYANDRRQLSIAPKIILLDEVDAPLHPSMSRNLVKTIQETLVNSFNINVIATTHSPSTVALAPENAIYVMQPGRPGLVKTTKAEALEILTVGVPTIAISYDGRRQVFVESPTDAKVYDSLYRLLKKRLASERSLDFIATGVRSPSGSETNTGCENVKRLVTGLAAAGNQSVFGLLDWDGNHDPSSRIAVLAHGRRNGIENVLFDPLLIGALIYRDCRDQLGSLGLEDISWIKLANSEPSMLQTLANTVSKTVIRSTNKNIVTCEYCGDFELQIDQQYLEMDDHELEKRILHVYPFLNRFVRGSLEGKLMNAIIDGVLTDQQGFLPVEIRDVFLDLINRSAHSG